MAAHLRRGTRQLARPARARTLLSVNERILVVDDESSVQEVARAYLEREGYIVDSAVDGEQALELIARKPPALIVLGVGDTIEVAGGRLRVHGRTSGTASIISAVSFVEFDTFARATHSRGSASYLLVWPAPGRSGTQLAHSLARRLPDATRTTP